MNKEEFLKELRLYLHNMNETEIKRFILYYDEMISDYIENGLSEEDATAKIGNPKDVARELLENYDMKINLPSTGYKVWNIILLVFGFPLWGSLLLAAVLTVLSIYIVIWCVPLTTGASCLGFLASSIIGIIGTPFVMVHNISIGLIQLGAAITSIGLAFLLGLITIKISKKLVDVTKHYNLKLLSVLKKVVKR